MRKKERELFALIREERERSDAALALLLQENRRLVEKIQQPEVRHVDPSVPQEPFIPPDFAELAHVGGEVPEFVSVGSAEQIAAEEAEIARVGTIEEDHA